VVSNSSFTDGISGSYDVTEQDYSTALVDNAIYQFGDFTAAADNPTGIDSDVSLANGDRIEIDTVPGEYTNFLEVTPSGSGDWVETWGLVNSAAVVGFIDHFAVSLRGLQHRRLFAP
jgi:hypothetical protein